MRRRSTPDKREAEPSTAVPHVNDAMELHRRSTGGAIASVPMRRPRYLVPPLSWILPYSSHRRIELDELGMHFLDLCDGVRTIEEIIEEFVRRYRLSFREAQISVLHFSKQLVERGVIAIVGQESPQSKAVISKQ